MKRSASGTRSGIGARTIVLCAGLACTVPWLAACESSAADPAEAPSPAATGEALSSTGAEPSARAEASAATAAPADDTALRQRLAEIDAVVSALMEPMGYGVPSAIRSPVDTIGNFYRSATDVVEPAACTDFHHATELGTDQDLTTAADDIFNPAGPYFPDGEFPEGPAESELSFQARVFGDEALAGALTERLLGSDCATYSRTSTWDDGSHTTEFEVAEVTEVLLDGLDTPTVRVVFARETWIGYDADGEVAGEGARGPWHHYVHVDGDLAATVGVTGIEGEEEIVAGVIAAFLDHMAAR